MFQLRVWPSFCRSYQTVCVLFALETVSWCQAPTMPSTSVYSPRPILSPLLMKSEPSSLFPGALNWKKQWYFTDSGA